MPSNFVAKFHPKFFDDLRKLDKRELDAVEKQIQKVKENPARFDRLHGKENCYKVRAGSLRIVYYIEGAVIWFLTVERRDSVYDIYLKRLHKIKHNIEAM